MVVNGGGHNIRKPSQCNVIENNIAQTTSCPWHQNRSIAIAFQNNPCVFLLRGYWQDDIVCQCLQKWDMMHDYKRLLRKTQIFKHSQNNIFIALDSTSLPNNPVTLCLSAILFLTGVFSLHSSWIFAMSRDHTRIARSQMTRKSILPGFK